MTIKQQVAIKKVMENHGNVSRAMIDAGYDLTTAKNPKNLTESEAWKKQMDKYLPDDKLLKKHEESLDATKWNDFTGEREADHTTRLRGVELGYKLKGKFVESSAQINLLQNQGINFIIQTTKDEQEFNSLTSKSEQDISQPKV